MATATNIDPETGEILDPLADLPSDDLGDEPELAMGQPEPQVWTETCDRCRGSGTYMMGTCFACAGRGVRTFKTSPEQRARRAKPTAESRQAYRDKQEVVREKRLKQWGEAHPELMVWLDAAAARGFAFAIDLRRGIENYGHMTERQQAAATRCMLADKERAEKFAQERMAAELRSEPVNAVNLEAVEHAFARAKGQGIKWPKLTLDGFQLAPAGANSRNAGAIYVTQGSGRDGPYLGKVLGGSFLPSHLCGEETKQAVLAAMADPLASAVAYGKKFGRCAVCNRELSDEESIARGIGPICAGRMGWA